MGKKSKNKLSFDEKSQIVISAMRGELRRVQALYGKESPSIFEKYGKIYTMGEIARLSGYARSSRFMLFLYEMCDRGLLAKSEWTGYDICGRGICSVNIQFTLPEFARSKIQKPMFTEQTTGQ